MGYVSQLEPHVLLDQFLADPSVGFRAETMPSGMPCFLAPFDVLMNADATLRERTMRLPGYQKWGSVLC